MVNTQATAEETLTADVRDLGSTWLVSKGVKRENLALARLGPRELFRLGWATTASGLLSLGVDSLSFYEEPSYAAEAAALFGAEACRQSWLQSASDALSLAGGEVCREWGLTLAMLLHACAGAPEAAQGVLAQTEGAGLAARAVPVDVVVATGIDGDALLRGGVRMNDLMVAKATPEQLTALGYRAFSVL